MTDETPCNGNRNIWAPWRIEYIESLGKGDDGCFLCRYRDNPADDVANLVLWRTERCMAVMNRFPYTGGHSLIVPLEHVPGLDDIDPETMGEMMMMARDLQLALGKAIGAEGFNVGINIGRCAGAGLPGHLHMHVVPRWGGDTNFMAVCGDVRVIPQALDKLYECIMQAACQLGLPKLK